MSTGSQLVPHVQDGIFAAAPFEGDAPLADPTSLSLSHGSAPDGALPGSPDSPHLCQQNLQQHN
eukprot:2275889-Karenia_brevis.AAC.1